LKERMSIQTIFFFCQKNRVTGLDEEGLRVNEWSGLGGGRYAGIAFIAMISEFKVDIYKRSHDH